MQPPGHPALQQMLAIARLPGLNLMRLSPPCAYPPSPEPPHSSLLSEPSKGVSTQTLYRCWLQHDVLGR